MSAFNRHNAHTHAVSIVVAALTSGELKLNGPDHLGGRAEADAKYINDLINSIAKNLTAKGE